MQACFVAAWIEYTLDLFWLAMPLSWSARQHHGLILFPAYILHVSPEAHILGSLCNQSPWYSCHTMHVFLVWSAISDASIKKDYIAHSQTLGLAGAMHISQRRDNSNLLATNWKNATLAFPHRTTLENLNTLSLCWHCSALHRTFYELLVFAMNWWSSNVCNSWTDVVYVTGNMCGVIFVCAMEAQSWLMMILLCKTLASNRMRRYTPLTWSTTHCSLNVSTPLSRSNLINNHINVSSQSAKAHNAIRALEGYTHNLGLSQRASLVFCGSCGLNTM